MSLVSFFNNRYVWTGKEVDKVYLINIMIYLGEHTKISFSDPQRFRKWMIESGIDEDPKIKEIKENSLHKYNVSQPGFYLFFYKDIGSRLEGNKRREENEYNDDDTIESADEMVTVKSLNESLVEMKKLMFSTNESVYTLANEVKDLKKKDETIKVTKEISKIEEGNKNIKTRVERIHEKINPLVTEDTAHKVNAIYEGVEKLYHKVSLTNNKQFIELSEECSRLKKEVNERISIQKELEQMVLNCEDERQKAVETIEYFSNHPHEFIVDMSKKYNMTSTDLVLWICEQLKI